MDATTDLSSRNRPAADGLPSFPGAFAAALGGAVAMSAPPADDLLADSQMLGGPAFWLGGAATVLVWTGVALTVLRWF